MAPETPQQEELTHFLRKLGEGAGLGEDSSLMRYVYAELRSIAEAYMSSQRGAASLQPTVLVHDAYVKLFARPEAIEWNDRVHFFALAARAMRQILVDHARKRRRVQPADSVLLERSFEGGTEVDLIDLDEALNQLAQLNERESRIVELRFFGGLTIPEAAEVMGLSEATIERDWATARAWLGARLRGH